MVTTKGLASERFSVEVGTAAAETGCHRTDFLVEKWDLDQIEWTVARDYDRGRLILPGSEPNAEQFMVYRCLPCGTYLKEDCNLIVNGGWQYIMNGFAGSSVTKFVNATSGRIGGGTSSTAVAYTDTDMNAATGSSSRQWELINAVPTVGATHTAGLILQASFPTTDGNFTWGEFATDVGTSGGTGASVAPFVTHGNASPGTKTSAQTWNATVTITWT